MGDSADGASVPSSSSSVNRQSYGTLDKHKSVEVSLPIPMGNIKFPSIEGNQKAAPYTIVNKRDLAISKEVTKKFIGDVCTVFFPDHKPKVIFSVTGAAANYTMPPFLEQVFNRGLSKAAQNTSAWIVTGGTDAGVMKCVGEAIKKTSVEDVPTIGIATFNCLSHQNTLLDNLDTKLSKKPKICDYVMEAEANKVTKKGAHFQPALLNPNHSHFILVNGDDVDFGHEIEFRSDFEAQVCEIFQIPLVLIVVNGGPNTLVTIAEGVKRQFPVIIMEGTGRVADAVTYKIKKWRELLKNPGPKDPNLVLEDPDQDNPWTKSGFKKGDPMEKLLIDILRAESLITIFNPYMESEGTFDVIIFRSIFRSKNYGSFFSRLKLSIECSRPDMTTELLDNADKIPDSQLVMDRAFECACLLDRPEIFDILLLHGAKKDRVNLSLLYASEIEEVKRKYAPFIQQRKFRFTAIGAQQEIQFPDLTLDPEKDAKLADDDIVFVKALFKTVDPVLKFYGKILGLKFGFNKRMDSTIGDRVAIAGEMQKLKTVKLTDILLWALVTGKYDLAKVVWARTKLPIHAGLLAYTLCTRLAGWFMNEADEYTELAEFFQSQSTAVIDNMDYDDALQALTLKWNEMGEVTALEMGHEAEAKDFMSHPHVQRYLDEKLYCHEFGKIAPGTHFSWILLAILIPPFIWTFYERFYEKPRTRSNPNESSHLLPDPDADAPPRKLTSYFHFYTLPIVKFLTSTLFYIGFLVVSSYVLVGQETYITRAEIVQFIWIFAYLIEEVNQFLAERMDYLTRTSNAFDMIMIVLYLAYFGTRVAAKAQGAEVTSPIYVASTDTLMIALVVAYLRILNVFSFDAKLGPLYFAILRMFGDVARWLFIFVLFMIGFQFAFMALTIQAGYHPLDLYPNGTFPISFFTIIGDWSTAIEFLEGASLGLFVLALYALITQVMMVNLLIAMMGDSYSTVKDNSDKEWKFSRYSLVEEFTNTSFSPPPLNLIILPLEKLHFVLTCCKNTEEEIPPQERDDLKKKLLLAMQKLEDEHDEEEREKVVNVGERIQAQIRDLMTEQVAERNFMSERFTALDAKLSKPGAPLAASGPAPAFPVQQVVSEVVGANEKQFQAVLGSLAAIEKELKLKAGPRQLLAQIQGKPVPVTWDDGVQQEHVVKVFDTFVPWQNWVSNISRDETRAKLTVRGIRFQSIDFFGSRVGFIKFKTDVVDSEGANVAGICFLRGGAVAILVILKVQESGKEYTVFTAQPRIPVGTHELIELPAGMLDGSGKFVGIAAKELKEETGIEIVENELLDLTGMAFRENPSLSFYSGAHPSPGGCDEFMRIFLYRRTVNEDYVHGLEGKLTGEGENEKIRLRLIKLPDVWKKTTDMKAFSAVYLYQRLLDLAKISSEY